jgi:hypothetical protein
MSNTTPVPDVPEPTEPQQPQNPDTGTETEQSK